ncbi:MAG: hypothetical protein GF317_00545 [Candidatus Lokiarchaeota archaeon]|nr:hypothetical protein [Candidatus Lokiarchaeota archaeon]MBD3198465.1 hypothetical protein [Candidatus Lokiarchaeota archaeon]
MASQGNKEKSISYDYLKTILDTLDSYRVRALIDAKSDIIESGIYSESEFYSILFKMIDEERLKFALYEYLKLNNENNLSSLKQFSKDHSIPFFKVLSFVELLEKEGLLTLEKLYDEIPGDDEQPSSRVFKDFKIDIKKGDITSIKPIYEPVKVIFDSEICSGCGICAGICPVNCIDIKNGFGKVDDDLCIRCGLCYFVCPRSYLPTNLLNMTQENTDQIKEYGKIGYFQEAYSARTKIKEIREVCQDGGISSTCLYFLFDSGSIDYALGAKMSEDPWRPEPFLMTKKEDVVLASGTKYVNNPNLSLLNENEIKSKKVAVVGVPCQIQALLKSEIYNIGFPSLNSITHRIGIFCMESFPYEEGFLKICEKLKVDVTNVKKTDINKGKFFVYTKDGRELTVPIKDISNLAREDCEVCFDLTSESADISIGSIGAPSGWNAVLIRTKKGKELYNKLIENDLIESKNLKDVKPGLPLLQKIAGFKRKGAKKHIDKKIQENKRAPFY